MARVSLTAACATVSALSMAPDPKLCHRHGSGDPDSYGRGTVVSGVGDSLAIPKLPRSKIGNYGSIIKGGGSRSFITTTVWDQSPRPPIIDLVIMSNNGSIITILIGNNGLVIICDNNDARATEILDSLMI